MDKRKYTTLDGDKADVRAEATDKAGARVVDMDKAGDSDKSEVIDILSTEQGDVLLNKIYFILFYFI